MNSLCRRFVAAFLAFILILPARQAFGEPHHAWALREPQEDMAVPALGHRLRSSSGLEERVALSVPGNLTLAQVQKVLVEALEGKTLPVKMGTIFFYLAEILNNTNRHDYHYDGQLHTDVTFRWDDQRVWVTIEDQTQQLFLLKKLLDESLAGTSSLDDPAAFVQELFGQLDADQNAAAAAGKSIVGKMGIPMLKRGYREQVFFIEEETHTPGRGTRRSLVFNKPSPASGLEETGPVKVLYKNLNASFEEVLAFSRQHKVRSYKLYRDENARDPIIFRFGYPDNPPPPWDATDLLEYDLLSVLGGWARDTRYYVQITEEPTLVGKIWAEIVPIESGLEETPEELFTGSISAKDVPGLADFYRTYPLEAAREKAVDAIRSAATEIQTELFNRLWDKIPSLLRLVDGKTVRAIRVQLTGDPWVADMVEGDANEIEYLFALLRHVVANAADSVVLQWEPDFKSPEIRLRVFVQKENLVIQVLDNGTGFSSEALQQLGTTHFTTREKTKGVSGRYGSGVFFSSVIAKQLKWELVFDNRPDARGAQVTLQIPLPAGLEERTSKSVNLLRQVPLAVPGSVGDAALVFRDSATFDLAALAVRYGWSVAVLNDSPEAAVLKKLLDALPGPKGLYAVGFLESSRFLEAYEGQISIDDRPEGFRVLGLRWDDLPPPVSAALESVLAYLDRAVEA